MKNKITDKNGLNLEIGDFVYHSSDKISGEVVKIEFEIGMVGIIWEDDLLETISRVPSRFTNKIEDTENNL